ncbi:hypothetical protein KBY28_19405 [Ruegeria pomeroyi]|uniref:hypothetical protein n=1 Tax=Ruegeria pomeroyi TaxID=89184 RepID=UPI001F23389A|nr:hypothetical protein [Ruegeria pomeroyi]MCE8510626.1 hypothetical protein [Ruegeria pomeroyi]
MRFLIHLLLSALIALPALAQDMQGNDTAGNWRVTHHRLIGIWDSMCDERVEQGQLVQRCYLRHVDVFSPQPRFAAQYLFVTPEGTGFAVEIGIEPGTLFAPGGIRIERAGERLWHSNWPGCLAGLGCTFSEGSAEDLITAMRQGESFRFTFRDRHGKAQDRNWPLTQFEAAWQDFLSQSHQRGLIGADARQGG